MSFALKAKSCSQRSERNKFVIKPRISTKQNREQWGDEQLFPTQNEVTLFIEHMISKSIRLREMIDKKGIQDENQFHSKHLFQSVCLKTVLKQIIQKMMINRRLGKNLKGMNRSNLIEIENSVWPIIQQQASLYISERDYEQEKEELRKDIVLRKQNILQEIQKLTRSIEGSHNKINVNIIDI